MNYLTIKVPDNFPILKIWRFAEENGFDTTYQEGQVIFVPQDYVQRVMDGDPRTKASGVHSTFAPILNAIMPLEKP